MISFLLFTELNADPVYNITVLFLLRISSSLFNILYFYGSWYLWNPIHLLLLSLSLLSLDIFDVFSHLCICFHFSCHHYVYLYNVVLFYLSTNPFSLHLFCTHLFCEILHTYSKQVILYSLSRRIGILWSDCLHHFYSCVVIFLVFTFFVDLILLMAV